jgi:hypothetical protein
MPELVLEQPIGNLPIASRIMPDFGHEFSPGLRARQDVDRLVPLKSMVQPDQLLFAAHA